MQCFKMDDPQLQLKLQVASVLCAALQQSDGPIAYLQDSHNLKFHNLGEYQYIENGPCPFLMCISDPGSVLSAQCTARKVSLAPVVYVAVEHVPGRKGTCSIAHFFCGASGEAFNDTAPGAQVQLLVSRALESLPLQSLLNLLGQGYEVVLCGQGWGGLVAHALASKLLLQLRQEIELAQKMGINLSALSQTEGKVVSFAYGSPLFGDTALGAAMSGHSLANGLHTVWRKGDACGHFLTLASEMAMQAEGSSAGARTDVHQQSVGFSLHSPQFQAVQQFALAVAAQMAGLSRTKHIAPIAAPIDTQKAHSLVDDEKGPGSSLSLTDHAAEFPVSSDRPSPASPLSSSPNTSRIIEATSLSSSPQPRSRPSLLNISSGPSSVASSPNGRSVGARALTAVKAVMAVKAAAAAPKSPARTASSKLLTPKAAVPVPGSPVGMKSATSLPQPASAPTAVLVAQGGGSGAGNNSSWVGPLNRLLKSAGDSPHLYTPIGQFWVLERIPQEQQAGAAPAAKPAAAAAAGKAATGSAGSGGVGGCMEPRVRMVNLPAGKVVGKGAQWLNEGNKELFETWGTGMSEVQAELMEAFPWATFAPTSRTGDGQAVDRRVMIRPNKSIELF